MNMKKSYKCVKISTGFLTNEKVRTLKATTKLLYLSCICGAATQLSCKFSTSIENMSYESRVKPAQVLCELRVLESLQLVTIEKIEIPKNRIEKNRIEKSINNINILKLKEAEEKSTENNAQDINYFNGHYFADFVSKTMLSLDTGLILLAPKVDLAFGGEGGFNEWFTSVSNSKNWESMDRNGQISYFKKALKDELKFRGVTK